MLRVSSGVSNSDIPFKRCSVLSLSMKNKNKTESCSLSEPCLKEDTGFFVAFQTNLGILPMLSTLYWDSIQDSLLKTHKHPFSFSLITFSFIYSPSPSSKHYKRGWILTTMSSMRGSTTMTPSQAVDASRMQLEWEKGHEIKRNRGKMS